RQRSRDAAGLHGAGKGFDGGRLTLLWNTETAHCAMTGNRAIPAQVPASGVANPAAPGKGGVEQLDIPKAGLTQNLRVVFRAEQAQASIDRSARIVDLVWIGAGRD